MNEDEAEEFVKSKITPSPAFQSPKSRREFGSIPESVDSIQVSLFKGGGVVPGVVDSESVGPWFEFRELTRFFG